MYQSGSKPALAAQTLQSGNANNQQYAGVKDNPLVSHVYQLENRDPAINPMLRILLALVNTNLRQGSN